MTMLAGFRPGRNVFRPGHPAPSANWQPAPGPAGPERGAAGRDSGAAGRDRGAAGRETGAAVVEFALILVVLVLLIFGIVEFGRAYHANIQLAHATREGVRELAVSGDRPDAVAVTRGAASSLDLDLLQVTTTECSPGALGTVRAQYPFEYSIPLFGSGTLTLQSEAVMRCGG